MARKREQRRAARAYTGGPCEVIRAIPGTTLKPGDVYDGELVPNTVLLIKRGSVRPTDKPITVHEPVPPQAPRIPTVAELVADGFSEARAVVIVAEETTFFAARAEGKSVEDADRLALDAGEAAHVAWLAAQEPPAGDGDGAPAGDDGDQGNDEGSEASASGSDGAAGGDTSGASPSPEATGTDGDGTAEPSSDSSPSASEPAAGGDGDELGEVLGEDGDSAIPPAGSIGGLAVEVNVTGAAEAVQAFGDAAAKLEALAAEVRAPAGAAAEDALKGAALAHGGDGDGPGESDGDGGQDGTGGGDGDGGEDGDGDGDGDTAPPADPPPDAEVTEPKRKRKKRR